MNISQSKKIKHPSPTRRIALSFALVILIGSLILSLPICNQGPKISYIDHLFMATTATCVTGLVTSVVVEQYSLIGQFVILGLIQIGGLGFLTIMSVFIVWMKKRLSYTNKLIMQEALNQDSLNHIGLYIRRVITYTLMFETLGACLLSIVFIPDYGVMKGTYYAIFHAISAFCNAGIDLLGANSLVSYSNNLIVNATICFLIFAGGLGFIVWTDIFHVYHKTKERFRYFKLKNFIKNLSLHSKIVLVTTFILIISGALMFFGLEYDGALQGRSMQEMTLVSIFQSITLRTAGFFTTNIGPLTDATKFIMCFYMFIGGSPAGTAGGIKTVTAVISYCFIRANVRGEKHISIMKRTLDDSLISRATSILMISVVICLAGAFTLSITENFDFIDILFEVVSAFATVGLSAGITPELSAIGKLIIIVIMFIGRIGPVTMVLVFAKKHMMMKGKDILYAKGNVLIG